MAPWMQRVRRFHRDQGGQQTVEWTLLLVAFGIPMIAVLAILLDVLVTHYAMVSFLETLPFP